MQNPLPDPSFNQLRRGLVANIDRLAKGLPLAAGKSGGGWNERAAWRQLGQALDAGQFDFFLARCDSETSEFWTALARLIEAGQFDAQLRDWAWVGIPQH